jgi:hypothetical protein
MNRRRGELRPNGVGGLGSAQPGTEKAQGFQQFLGFCCRIASVVADFAVINSSVPSLEQILDEFITSVDCPYARNGASLLFILLYQNHSEIGVASAERCFLTPHGDITTTKRTATSLVVRS